MDQGTIDQYLADLGTRVKLAASPATAAEVLAYLARDDAVTVRAAAALNPSLPSAAELRLAGDGDERVRMLLARKVAAALPGLPSSAEANLRDRTMATLSALVRDEAVRIRSLLADVVATLPAIPHSLLLALARDSEASVSEPVLRLSPLLSTADLLALLDAPPHEATATAIACRANLPASVADVIAASADSAAIRALLANGSAAIRETTLDALVARAQDEPGWHMPLVQRPVLPNHTARALSEIVANHVLKVLAARDDLAPDLLVEIRRKLEPHLAPPGRPVSRDEALMQAARQLEAKGKLTEETLLTALRTGDIRRSSALLAVAAGVALDVVDRAATLRSAKALLSLVWKAGFTMRSGAPVQLLLGQIGPAALLGATKDGGFPLSSEELGWQLEFLGCPPM